MARLVPRSGSTQKVSLFEGPVGGSDGIDDTNVAEEDSYEAGEPQDRAAQNGRANPVCVENP